MSVEKAHTVFSPLYWCEEAGVLLELDDLHSSENGDPMYLVDNSTGASPRDALPVEKLESWEDVRKYVRVSLVSLTHRILTDVEGTERPTGFFGERHGKGEVIPSNRWHVEPTSSHPELEELRSLIKDLQYGEVVEVWTLPPRKEGNASRLVGLSRVQQRGEAPSAD